MKAAAAAAMTITAVTAYCAIDVSALFSPL